MYTSRAQPTAWLAARLPTILRPMKGPEVGMLIPEYERSEQVSERPESSEGQVRIVRAAYPLFVEQGYVSVSMQEIADAVPLNKATLYHHFQNKDDLFQ